MKKVFFLRLTNENIELEDDTDPHCQLLARAVSLVTVSSQEWASEPVHVVST